MHPIFLHLGFLEIRWYGVMYAAALLTAIQLVLREVKRRKLQYKDDDVLNIILITFVGGLFGGRLYYVLFNLSYYLQNPGEIPAVWHGGMAIHGGIMIGFLAGYLACRHYKINPWVIADVGSPYVLLGQVFGRFGNFMNGDAHGLPTNLPWGLVFPAGTAAGNEFPNIPIHPTMLYELILNLFFFIILYRIQQKGNYKNGFILCLYLIFYSIARFIVSFFRADDLYLLGLSAPHLASVLLIVGCTFAIFRYKLWAKE